MPTVLITGANRGLGLEFTKQYAEDGWQVIACTRHPALAEDLNQLAQKYLKQIAIHKLEVADFKQINELASKIKDQPLDLLLNNAGIYGGEQKFGTLEPEKWLQVFTINTIAPIKVAEAFLPNLLEGHKKQIVSVTSKMGSIDDNTSGNFYAYRSSKAALNMANKSLSIDLKSQGITAIVIHPGWVQTDMGGDNAPTKPYESVSGMRKTIANLTLSDTGKFYEYTGKEVAW
jgi:NAD(P)-dependent dehydrogenase (short-subunit alcohol dehydrogenase family)